MSQPFKVDFSFNCANLLLVVVIVKLPGSKYVLCFFVLVFLRSSSILKYVEVVFLLISLIYDPKKRLAFSTIPLTRMGVLAPG